MKKALLLAAFVVIIGALGFAQGSASPLQTATDASGRPIPSAAVRVCSIPTATLNPCTPLATTYTDVTLGTQCSAAAGPISGTGCANPGVTDSAGNYQFFGAGGNYWIEVSAAGTTYSYVLSVAINATTNLLSGTNTWTAKNTFSGGLTTPSTTFDTSGNGAILVPATNIFTSASAGWNVTNSVPNIYSADTLYEFGTTLNAVNPTHGSSVSTLARTLVSGNFTTLTADGLYGGCNATGAVTVANSGGSCSGVEGSAFWTATGGYHGFLRGGTFNVTLNTGGSTNIREIVPVVAQTPANLGYTGIATAAFGLKVQNQGGASTTIHYGIENQDSILMSNGTFINFEMAPFTISSAAITGCPGACLATITTSAPHGYSTADKVEVTVTSDAFGCDGFYSITVTGGSTFTYTPIGTANGTCGSAGTVAKLPAVPMVALDASNRLILATAGNSASIGDILFEGPTTVWGGWSNHNFFVGTDIASPVAKIDNTGKGTFNGGVNSGVSGSVGTQQTISTKLGTGAEHVVNYVTNTFPTGNTQFDSSIYSESICGTVPGDASTGNIITNAIFGAARDSTCTRQLQSLISVVRNVDNTAGLTAPMKSVEVDYVNSTNENTVLDSTANDGDRNHVGITVLSNGAKFGGVGINISSNNSSAGDWRRAMRIAHWNDVGIDLAASDSGTAAPAIRLRDNAESSTLFTLDGTGKVTASGYATGTNCQLGGAAGTTSPAACGSAAAGMIAIPASQTTYTVNTTAVTANSEIFLQQITDNSGLPSSPTCNGTLANPLQSARVASTSFTFTLTSIGNVTCFKYWILN